MDIERVLRILQRASQPADALPPIIKAVVDGDRAAVERQLDDGVRLEKMDSWNNTPLMIAVMQKDHEMAEFLIEKGANKNCVARFGITPIHLATKNNDLQMVDILLGNPPTEGTSSQQVNVSAIDNDGDTPLHIAVMYEYEEIAERLLERGASAEARNDKDQSILEMAIQTKNISMIKLILEHISNIDDQDRTGVTAFMLACRVGDPDVVQILVDKGANVDFAISNGMTAVTIAAASGELEVLRVLKRAGADMHGGTGVPAAMMALMSGHREVAAFLMENV